MLMSTAHIESVRIKGFRSLADFALDEVPRVAVFVGANGSGKSNFIHFFEMLSWMLRSRRLADFVAFQGGADDQLFEGSKKTRNIEANVRLRTDQSEIDYWFELVRAHPDRFIFAKEAFRLTKEGSSDPAPWQHLGSGHSEPEIVNAAQSSLHHNISQKTASVIVNLLRGAAVFQCHDTSNNSEFKRYWDVEENRKLRSHGGNLAPVLYRLEHEYFPRYEWICGRINSVLPNFDRFAIEQINGKVILNWRTKRGNKTIGAHLTSDGSLRLFALITLLNLPSEMLPQIILLDEPELGLHPAAVSLVGAMIKKISHRHQIFVATQSPLLVDAFDLDDVIVLELRDGRTEVNERNGDEFQTWLDEYSTGEMWQKNLLGGRP